MLGLTWRFILIGNDTKSTHKRTTMPLEGRPPRRQTQRIAQENAMILLDLAVGVATLVLFAALFFHCLDIAASAFLFALGTSLVATALRYLIGTLELPYVVRTRPRGE